MRRDPIAGVRLASRLGRLERAWRSREVRRSAAWHSIRRHRRVGRTPSQRPNTLGPPRCQHRSTQPPRRSRRMRSPLRTCRTLGSAVHGDPNATTIDCSWMSYVENGLRMKPASTSSPCDLGARSVDAMYASIATCSVFSSARHRVLGSRVVSAATVTIPDVRITSKDSTPATRAAIWFGSARMRSVGVHQCPRVRVVSG